MFLSEIHDRSLWDGFVAGQPWSPFPQSWTWGEFQRSRGRDVRRFFLYGALRETPLLACQLQLETRRFSGYWFAPRGPVFCATAKERPRPVIETFFHQLLQQKLSHTLFYRVEPLLTLEEGIGALPLRFLRHTPINPATTRLLDLSVSEETLLKEMHEKTRYNIRVASKHGVTVRVGTDEHDLRVFLALMEETAVRDGFASHPTSYLRATYEALASSGMARLRLAEHDGVVLAANMEIAYGDTVTYLHGASSSDARNVMAPFALHWEAIREAKREGYRGYDFWGANPEARSAPFYKESWEGITRFKRGWGGRTIDLMGTWDLPMNRWLYALAFPRSLGRE
jgi:lipid II:glycine glycyltransferase (peptidoglycan interpeptide bridge formation enzyme)